MSERKANKNTGGILSRLILPPLPVPILIRQFLEEPGKEGFEFLEENRIPESWASYLSRKELFLKQDPFFLRDRSRIRIGLVQKKGRRPGDIASLSDSLRRFMLVAGKRPDQLRILILEPGESTGVDSVPPGAACLVVWIPEKPAFERFFSGKMQKLSLPPAPGAIPAKNEKNRQEFLYFPDLFSSERGRLPGFEGWSGSSEWRYRIPGNLPGVQERYAMLSGNKGSLYIVMVSSSESISEDFLPNFFDRIRTAAKPVETHQSMLAVAPPRDIHSISFQINRDGTFKLSGYHFSPLVWRARSGRATWFPEMEDRPRVVRGRFDPGDVFFLIPGSFSPVERKSLSQLPPVAPDGSFYGSLESWLDQGLRGRGILLWIPPREPV